MQDPSVLVCRFEDLVGEQGGGSAEKQRAVLRDLAVFLGYPLSEKEIDLVAKQLYGGTWTFRKGKIGLWKDYFSEKSKRLFKQLMGRAVIDWGYEKDDSW